MIYRLLGRTGISVSAISLGCEGFMNKSGDEVRADFDFAEANGINFFDLYASNPDLRSAIGVALKGRREKFVIQGHIGSTAVAAVMVGCRSTEEMQAALDWCDADKEARDYAAALAGMEKFSWAGHCMYCSHCAPCPVGIEVANVIDHMRRAVARFGY